MEKWLVKDREIEKQTERKSEEEKPLKKSKKSQKYRQDYTKEWPCLLESSLSPEHVFCTVCSRDICISHGGRDDCRRHIEATVHKKKANDRQANKKLSAFLTTQGDETSVIKAELLYTAYISEHNLPISCTDHAGPLFRKMFPDSKIAAKYSCGRTKTTSLLKCLSSSTQNDITGILKTKPFALATDGSNDKSNVKLYPIVVTYFCEKQGKIVNMLLSILECNDNTGKGIFDIINEEFEKRNIPWKNCVAFSSDNASTMTGHIKGVISFIKQVQPDINFQGCVCHLLHLAAKNGCAAIKNFDVEELLIDIYFYLQNSSKRQHSFQLCQDIYGLKPHKILKYISTRWLSMHGCIERILQQWEPLLMYFCETNEINKNEQENARYIKIKEKLENPITKAYLLFLENVLPLFLSANIFLQQDEPLIHKIHGTVNNLLMGLIVRFLKPSSVDDCTDSFTKLECAKRKKQKSSNDLVIGAATRAHIKNIPADAVEKFYNDARNFYVKSVQYVQAKLPVDDLFLKHAEIANVSARKKITYESIEFINGKFPNVLSDKEKDRLEMEFSLYQFEDFEELDLKNDRTDSIWHKISKIADINGATKYVALPKLIKVLLLVPHSNATSERVFSVVRKNQTDFRPTLGTETLTSLLVEKQKNSNSNCKCYDNVFSNEVLSKAKKSAWSDICSKRKEENPLPSTLNVEH